MSVDDGVRVWMQPGRDDMFAAYALDDRRVPQVRVNFVQSVDGAVTLGGRSGSLGGATDRAAMQVLRAMSDVVLVGAGTVRAEGYGGMAPEPDDTAWRRDHGRTDAPRLAVVSEGLHLSASDPVFARAVHRPIVVTCAAAPSDRRDALARVADVLVCGENTVDLHDMQDRLAADGLRQVLCEGGPHLFGSLLDAGLVDELCLTVSPHIVGGTAGRIVRGAAEAARRYRLRAVVHDDEGYVLLRYAR